MVNRNWQPRGGWAWLALCSTLLGACSQVDLYAAEGDPYLADRLTISGKLCTDDPGALGFPVRILFLVDGYQLLDKTDPAGRRVEALQRVLRRFGGQANYSFVIVQFGDGVRNLVGDFSRDQAALLEASEQLRVTQACGEHGCRDLMGAVSLGATLIQDDLLSTPPGSRSRTRYVIVLFTGGWAHPMLEAAECAAGAGGRWECTTSFLAERVRTLREWVMAQGGAGLQLHAALLDDPEASSGGIREQTLVQALADAGAGTALRFATAGAITFDGLELGSTETVFLKKSIVISNLNTRVADGVIRVDSDGDGLPDEDELRLGTSPIDRDTDGDRLGDLLELRFGAPYDPLVADQPMVCQASGRTLDLDQDQDHDLLTDCEERLLGSEPSVMDTDGDGLPDGHEFLWGTNLLADDQLDDSDLDGEPNGRELKVHTDPLGDDREGRWDLAYRQEEWDEGVRRVPYASQPRSLTGVTVTGVALLATAGVGTLRFTPGTPPTLTWTDPDPYDPQPGPAVPLERNGRYVLSAHDPRRTLSVDVLLTLLPRDATSEAIVIGASDRNCFSFRTRNVTLRQTLPDRDRAAPGWNRILVYLAQAPRDAPHSPGIFRVAELPVQFLEPDQRTPELAEILLDERDFVLLDSQ